MSRAKRQIIQENIAHDLLFLTNVLSRVDYVRRHQALHLFVARLNYTTLVKSFDNPDSHSKYCTVNAPNYKSIKESEYHTINISNFQAITVTQQGAYRNIISIPK